MKTNTAASIPVDSKLRKTMKTAPVGSVHIGAKPVKGLSAAQTAIAANPFDGADSPTKPVTKKTKAAILDYPVIRGIEMSPRSEVTAFIVVDRADLDPDDEQIETNPCVMVSARLVGFNRGANAVTFSVERKGEVPLFDFEADDESPIYPETKEGREEAKKKAVEMGKEQLLFNARRDYEAAYYVMNACSKEDEKASKVFSEAPPKFRTKMVASLGHNSFKALGGTAGQPIAEVTKVFLRIRKTPPKGMSATEYATKLDDARSEARRERATILETFGVDVKKTNDEVRREEAEEQERKDAEEKAARKAARASGKDPKAIIRKMIAAGITKAQIAAILASSEEEEESDTDEE